VKNLGYTIIDNEEILINEELNIYEQSLMIAILSYFNNKKGYAYPNYKQLMKRSKIKKDDTLIKNITSLINKGYIKKETLPGIGCRYYLLKCRGRIADTPQMGVPHKKGNPIEEVTPTLIKGGNLPHERGTTSTKTIIKKNTIYINLNFIDDIIDKVKITQEQYDRLIDIFNTAIVHKKIVEFDNYITNCEGDKYKDHYRALNLWCSKAAFQAPDSDWSAFKTFK